MATDPAEDFDPEAEALAADVEEMDRAKVAASKRAEFLSLIQQGQIKVGLLPRELMAGFGIATANLMLLKILTGKTEVTTARQAADVAKIALDIARLELGQGAPTAEDMDEDARKAAIAKAMQVMEDLRARANAAGRAAIAAVPDPAESTL